MTVVYDGHTNELKIWDDVVKLIVQQKNLAYKIYRKNKGHRQ